MDSIKNINIGKMNETEYLLCSIANKERLYKSIKNVKNNLCLKEINFLELEKISNLKSNKKK